MSSTKKIAVTAALASAFLLGMLSSTQASASPYGPSGLGANLHRRHVMKQAVKNAKAGKPVRNSAILWFSGGKRRLLRSF